MRIKAGKNIPHWDCLSVCLSQMKVKESRRKRFVAALTFSYTKIQILSATPWQLLQATDWKSNWNGTKPSWELGQSLLLASKYPRTQAVTKDGASKDLWTFWVGFSRREKIDGLLYSKKHFEKNGHVIQQLKVKFHLFCGYILKIPARGTLVSKNLSQGPRFF